MLLMSETAVNLDHELTETVYLSRTNFVSEDGPDCYLRLTEKSICLRADLHSSHQFLCVPGKLH